LINLKNLPKAQKTPIKKNTTIQILFFVLTAIIYPTKNPNRIIAKN